MTISRVRFTLVTLIFCAVSCLAIGADTPPKAAPAKGGGTDAELVEKVIAARRDYQQSLIALYDQYAKSGDRERAKWVEDELKAYHLAWKPSYRLDILDVPADCIPMARPNLFRGSAQAEKNLAIWSDEQCADGSGGCALHGGRCLATRVRGT